MTTEERLRKLIISSADDLFDCSHEPDNDYNQGIQMMRDKLISNLTQIMSLMPKVTGETSDGYHTFNELYHHRCLLWINLCQMISDKCYLVKEHFEGWFLLGAETPNGQISYHCPNKFLPLVENIAEKKVEYDGHTPNDTLKRLEQLADSKALMPKAEGKEASVEEIRLSIQDACIGSLIPCENPRNLTIDEVKNAFKIFEVKLATHLKQKFDVRRK